MKKYKLYRKFNTQDITIAVAVGKDELKRALEYHSKGNYRIYITTEN